MNKKNKYVSKLAAAILLASSCFAVAQNTHKKNDNVADTTKKQASASGIKPYSEIITDKTVSKQGLFTVHHEADKYYFELPDSLMKREILVVTRYRRTPGDASFYGGEIANEQSVYFEKGPDNKVFLRVALYINQSKDSTQAIYKAVEASNLDPIVASFDIKAFSKDSNGVVIDVTDFFKGDNQVVSLTPSEKQSAKFGVLSADKSYISAIKTFPINTEVHTVKTFAVAPGGGSGMFQEKPIPAGTQTGFLSVEMNTSFLLLPKVPMQKRYFDERVGFFADRFTEYGDDDQRVKPKSFIIRWRLEPRPEDTAKFYRGELVEPAKPIVYYIDPATPKKWRKYLIAGVEDWNKAFEQAGFKNAISAKEWPENDTTMDMEDARYSVIRYFASPISNAYGPNVHDPRSGEILESHIGWYHNVMTLLHNWYMIQCGAVDQKARTMKFDDTLMGNLIRFVSSHEIGHTLGLRHNMGASSQTPVDSLRNKHYLDVHGHTVSIMDYARFDYVAQPEDHIPEYDLFPRIGEYDKWAIEWGYKLTIYKNADDERIPLFEATTKRLDENPKLWFGGEGSMEDPRSQSEDLGNNSMKASIYGIKNLKRVMAHLEDWTREDGDTYYNFQEMYNALINQYVLYLNHVTKNIAGMYFTNKASTEPGDLFVPVEKEKQKAALEYFNKQLFITPKWLINDEVIKKLGIRPVDKIQELQEFGLNRCMNAAILLNIIECSARSSNPYTLAEYLKDLTNDIWTELDNHQLIDIYRRNLQKHYINKLEIILHPEVKDPLVINSFITEPPSDISDVQSLIRAFLRDLKNKIDIDIPSITDEETKYHLLDVSSRIDNILKRTNYKS